MKAVVLAGGRGTRLKPYTTVFPKPLMPIGERPILEILVRQLAKAGFDEVIFAVGHLAELIMAFFDNGRRFGVPISYSREEEPLGTAAPLGLLRDRLTETFLVINGDVLSTVNFGEMLARHRDSRAVTTVGLTRRQVQIDYGVVKLDGDSSIAQWMEKPALDYLVSIGIYFFEPRALDYIEPRVRLDLPTLVLRLKEAGEVVKGYLHAGYWLDIGRPEDYEAANRDIEGVSQVLGL